MTIKRATTKRSADVERRRAEDSNEGRVRHYRALLNKATRLVVRAGEHGGALGIECLEKLLHVLEQVNDVEASFERELNAVEAQLQAPQVMCVICREMLRPGDSVLRLPCMCVFHEHCIMPSLRNGTITSCPLDRVQVPPGVLETLPVWPWRQQSSVASSSSRHR